ncbi:GNAT family N-acetyltransferase [Proteiniclasticum sp. QWL-01]|uniref:GNAT family N-acetyltransferase n=1 Tax=Proteiniclasticum sp. QWL-01 TaxID=3036945 RepID=UPI002410C9DE|nr:GNAT family N-acetyltransferase [Proteiniclasticum sp. QWL-01]WFF74156.1 GNAT family N-acetyltransferase [Proteiniclasticum sp. QWL-01]
MTGLMFSPDKPDFQPDFLPCTEADLPIILAPVAELLATVETERMVDLTVVRLAMEEEIRSELPDYTKISVGGEILGWYHLIHSDQGVELDDFNILNEFQSRGLGSLALNRIIRQTALVEYPIWCTVTRGNEAAIRFYQRHGFKQTAETDQVITLSLTQAP